MKNLALVLMFCCSFAFSSSAADLIFKPNERHANDIQRDNSSKGAEVVGLAGIKPGMKVFDLLGGGGYYSEIISDVVGAEGRVYLHNNQAYMPWIEKELVARLANNRLPNVQRFDKETEDLGLKKQSFDAMFYILGYHDIYHQVEGWKIDKDSFLPQITSAIKPGGKLVIVDHSAKPGSGIEFSQELHRIDVEYVKKEVASLGFKLVVDSNILANPRDERTISPFKPEMRRKTDRFVLIFEKG
ncbi:class I SAM-dependent methyltransferase [Thalassotalea atypica]|uniref:class I SAM-dependent methyltransferase n=1 Tax=Thalassotalea atypica TaxID=2054316 RepID=UPI002573C585|nr:class I SAM-dependent methyltransferase [Thalassotalea atypica]